MQNNLKEMRALMGLTQENLADMLGVSRQTVISIETGRYNPSLTLAFKISRLFQCPIDRIFIFEEAERCSHAEHSRR